MESLDSLWFYSNVLSSRRPPGPDSAGFIDHVREGSAIQEVLKPVLLAIVEDQKNEKELEAENSSPVTPKSAEVAVLSDIHKGEVAEAVEYYSPSPREKEQRRRRSRSKRGMQRNRRRILGEIDLGFHGEAEASGCDWGFLEENFGYKSQFNLNDNMAMKEQLKTWAYAVACTVR